ncbi:hypothetical protein HAX54_043067 [Datura stramonium]|uniref:AP2/ERF domain-containing protein n=1 Tax=Datura stramonium TaxID=4076 RepID=A0ABS8SMX3_DATST|nr:hypothetical protein [Datura stramonium]
MYILFFFGNNNRHHQHGRWQARIGRVAGNKDLYLGTFSTQEEAAEAYDIAAIKFRGLNAVTNFEINRYDVKSILESSTLPIGGAAKRLKDVEQAEIAALDHYHRTSQENLGTTASHHHLMSNYGASQCWPNITSALHYQQAQPALNAMHNYNNPYGQQQRLWCKQEVQEYTSDQSFQDFHPLQLGNGHNFLHPSSLGLDISSSIDHNNVTYSTHGVGVGGGGGFVLPQLNSIIPHQESQANGLFGGGGENNNNHEVKQLQLGNDNMFGYYHSQQLTSNTSVKTASLYDHHHQESVCNNNNWMSAAVPVALASRGSTVAVCHGAAPTFTVWNDT